MGGVPFPRFRRAGLFFNIRMTYEAFIFIKTMFFAKEASVIFQIRMAYKAPILITAVLLAP
jgi:hypothetical protein